MKEIIVVSILFAISLLMFILSIRSFREKGFLFNNAYLYASKEEREVMNKKPYYRQTAIVFFFFGKLIYVNNDFEKWSSNDSEFKKISETVLPNNDVLDGAASALIMLGFPAAATNKVVQAIVKSEPTATVEQVIKLALKQL